MRGASQSAGPVRLRSLAPDDRTSGEQAVRRYALGVRLLCC
ncbi:hypothetical protein [Streptomyces lydicus]